MLLGLIGDIMGREKGSQCDALRIKHTQEHIASFGRKSPITTQVLLCQQNHI